ncbi:16S rRNA (guanine(966)-N(2))-methyltransferase RsmD [Alteribacillus sp. JSM 102045]|uniref:16S rRNA (guanine(966)-N(2))-methyltransferase RsmD n=1 Tax=Alteribacillus sp. JSM 102045 TaxID=1562101 RepID=UPI0035C26800
MRVISGKYKGTTLKAVPGMKTRPTSDKVKEALFHRIGPYFSGGSGLDLYAGTGSLGIEAMSRGFSSFVFVDKAPQAVKVIKTNVKAAGLNGSCEVYRNDAKRALAVLTKRKKSFDLIFMDPPYAHQDLAGMLQTISETGLITPGGQIVCEHRSSTALPDTVASLNKQNEDIYGDTGVSIYGLEK